MLASAQNAARSIANQRIPSTVGNPAIATLAFGCSNCTRRRPRNNVFRFMGSKSHKKNALIRQRNRNPEKLSSITEDHSNQYLASSLSASRPLSDPLPTAPADDVYTGSFDRSAGLSKLRLQPSLDHYLETYDLSDGRKDKTARNAVGAGTAAPKWETNKMIFSPTSSQQPLRNNSSLADRTKNEEDDGFLIDRDSMFDPNIHLPHAPKNWKGYEPATPLSDFLMQRIGVSGQPISTAEYMRHALTHPLYGYYTAKDRKEALEGTADSDDDDWSDDDYSKPTAAETSTNDENPKNTIFGKGGDFVTAPELSSVFGHSLCVWFMTVWQQEPLGRPKEIQFVELGPGRGTLMADLLELAHSSKLLDFGKSIQTVHLVEASRELRNEQQKTLEAALGHLVKLEFSGRNQSEETKDDENAFVNSIRIEWHDDFASFQSKRDKSIPTMVLMQEFLDALPIHQFQKTEDGWRERMIDVVSVDETNDEGVPIPSTKSDGKEGTELIPRLRQVLAPNITPAVDLLLSSSYDQYAHFPENTVVEICPDALFLIQDVAKVLEESQGAALIIDYGEEGTTDTLRAFSRHQQVPLTSLPGQVDVTADVDFFALKNSLSVEALKRNKDSNTDGTNAVVPSSIHAFGPVSQGEFLMKMGAGELTMNAIEKDETTEEQAQAFADALKYLVLPEHMGQKFKVLALSRKRDDLFGPPGIE